jgi:NAD(P)-dependent dehydrogenase (short-subunit alcohol dehydrogenase family)
VGDHANLLAIKLDVTRPQDAEAAVEAAVAKFDRIDILVNNAGNFFAGFFEELRPEQVRSQIEMEGNGETRFGEGAHWLRFTQHAGSSGDDHMPSAV